MLLTALLLVPADFGLVDADGKELPVFSGSLCSPVPQPTGGDIRHSAHAVAGKTVRPSVFSQFHVYRDNSTILNFEGTRSKYQMH